MVVWFLFFLTNPLLPVQCSSARIMALGETHFQRSICMSKDLLARVQIESLG